MSRLRETAGSARRLLSRRWAVIAIAAVATLGVVAFIVARARGVFHPGSALGMTFGIAAATALALVMVYSVRRGLARVRPPGRQQQYMRLHLWAGGLFLVLLLLHTDFRLPSGAFTAVLWGVSMWVVFTGLLGLLLQRSTPRVLSSVTTFEVHVRRIPELVAELRSQAESVAEAAPARVREFYQRELAPEMAEPRMVGAALMAGSPQVARGQPSMDLLRRTLTAESAASLDELGELHRAKREMDVHFTLQRLLRGWLWLHLPVSIVLLGLVVVHVFLILYF